MDNKTHRKDTKTKILCAAEKIFAEKGYHNTSLRDITSSAEVNIAAVNYHFGSKEKLFEELLKTRLNPINDIRMELLEQIINKADSSNSLPDLREILKSFFDPVMDLMEKEQNSRQFIVILGAILHHPDLKLKKIFIQIIRPVAESYFKCICRALPEIDPEIILIRVQFALGVFHHGMNMLHRPFDREDKVLNILHGRIPENKIFKREIIDFMIKGIKGQ